jgi:two-component system response regulator AtoC
MKVLIVDDEQNIRESLRKYLSLEGIDAEIAADGETALSVLADGYFDAVVLDLRLPGMSGQDVLDWMQSRGIRAPVVMISAHGEIDDAVTALKSGASDYLSKPFDPAELVRRLSMLVSSRKRDDLIEAEQRTSSSGSRLVGDSSAMRNLARLIERVAPSDATVLVTGESGTGKEVVAREIHAHSHRSGEPFVAVNIGAISEQLMESELFGHEKGAFTGASARKPGLFELAGSGTLFLDEIGEMPMHLQVKLLRVLQDRKLRRLGGTVDLPVNARIISATNRDVEAMVGAGKFREDLYYRLNVVRLSIPPLRERAEDIPSLSEYLVRKISARMNKPSRPFSPEALAALSAYPFPGNVRELENILERALIYCQGNVIGVDDIDLRDVAIQRDTSVPRAPEGQTLAADQPQSRPVSLTDAERQAIESALARHGGNRTHAAAELGISRRTIINKIKAFGIE